MVHAGPVCPDEVEKSRRVKLPLGVFTTYKAPFPGIVLAAGSCVAPVSSMKYFWIWASVHQRILLHFLYSVVR